MYAASYSPNPKDFWNVFGCGGPVPANVNTALTAPVNWNTVQNRIASNCTAALQNPCYYAEKINAYLQGLYALPNGAVLVEQLTANLNVTSHTSTERMAEAHIYGSSRLGISAQVVETTVKRWKLPCTTNGDLAFTAWYPASSNTANRNLRGWKRYELTNHLGNVLAVVSDKHLSQDVDANNKIDFYFADVISAQDYWPFGSVIAERQFVANGAGDYRYGYNGQERAPEIAENHHTAEYWEMDPLIARRWNRDPVSMPHISDYHVNNNNPILNSDPNGANPIIGGAIAVGRTAWAIGVVGYRVYRVYRILDAASSRFIPQGLTTTVNTVPAGNTLFETAQNLVNGRQAVAPSYPRHPANFNPYAGWSRSSAAAQQAPPTSTLQTTVAAPQSLTAAPEAVLEALDLIGNVEVILPDNIPPPPPMLEIPTLTLPVPGAQAPTIPEIVPNSIIVWSKGGNQNQWPDYIPVPDWKKINWNRTDEDIVRDIMGEHWVKPSQGNAGNKVTKVVRLKREVFAPKNKNSRK